MTPTAAAEPEYDLTPLEAATPEQLAEGLADPAGPFAYWAERMVDIAPNPWFDDRNPDRESELMDDDAFAVVWAEWIEGGAAPDAYVDWDEAEQAEAEAEQRAELRGELGGRLTAMFVEAGAVSPGEAAELVLTELSTELGLTDDDDD